MRLLPRLSPARSVDSELRRGPSSHGTEARAMLLEPERHQVLGDVCGQFLALGVEIETLSQL